MNQEIIQSYLRKYLGGRPLFLSLIRAKEATLFHPYAPLKSPVLDVGCGDGFFTRTVFGTLDQGLDVKESRIGESRRDGGYKEVIEYDGQAFPFENNTFATIVSNCVLEHIFNIDEVISEMHRVLAPGGKILVSVMARPWEDHLFGALFLGNSYRSYMRAKQVHVNMMTDDEWRRKFTSVGLRVNDSIGYLTPSQCRMVDIAHYLSIPSLISYVLLHRWVLFPSLTWYPVRFLASFFIDTCPPEQAGAIFYELSKEFSPIRSSGLR